ncbi:MAG: hypothetical protein ACOCP8_06655 [archaeon]
MVTINEVIKLLKSYDYEDIEIGIYYSYENNNCKIEVSYIFDEDEYKEEFSGRSIKHVLNKIYYFYNKIYKQ